MHDAEVSAQGNATPTQSTDIAVDSVAFLACSFEDRAFAATVLGREIEEVEGDGIGLSAEIGIWLDDDQLVAYVRLKVTVMPHSQPTWAASADVLGRFSAGENPVVPLERFANYNGIAYLVPFVRERLANLTSASVYGSYMLPPLSVPRLLALAASAQVGKTVKAD